MNNRVNYTFMAFAKGAESTDAPVIKRYIGVAPVFVLGVNPNKTELEKLYNTQLENAPEYISEIEVGEDRHKVKNVRIDFIVKTDAKICGIEFVTKIPFFIRNEYRYNRDKTKVQVIDKYARTAWVTIEQAKTHEIPIYKNGPANLDKDYRPAYVGEEELTNFLKVYLTIPDVMRYVNEKWIMVDNPSDCEARLEKISNYFNGDFSELKSIIAIQPTNKVKVLFGVRSTDDNRQYQTVYTRMFLRNRESKYNKLATNLQEAKAAGAYSNVEFSICDLKEYTVEATDFNKSNGGPFPSSPSIGDDSPWGFA